MENRSANHQSSSLSTCEVCGCSLNYLDSLQYKNFDYPVCKSFACQRVMSNKNSMSPILFKAHLNFQQKVIHDLHKKNSARKKHIEQGKNKERQENKKISQAVKLNHPELFENNTQIVVIPTGLATLIPPVQERVDKYVEHLKKIISEAGIFNNVTEMIYDQHQVAHKKRLKVEQRFSQNPALEQLSNQLCGLCKGGCCVAGKEHAYLSAFTIRSMMDNNQDLSGTEILDQYLSRISSETVENSCINQTKTGCALPRNLRSDICNAFYCGPVKSYQNDMETSQRTGQIIAIQRSNTYSNNFEPDVDNKIINVTLISDQPYQKLDFPKNSSL